MTASIQFQNIPAELRVRPQWVVWKYARDTKLPCNPRTGDVDDATNPAVWTSFEAACKAAEAYRLAGVGFAFSPDDPYVGIDLDDCIDDAGALLPWARQIVDTLATYSEISPSGKGVKLWVKGTIPKNLKTKSVEMYAALRFFTVTGNRLLDAPPEVRSVNGELSALYEQYRPARPAPNTPQPTPTATENADHARRYALAALEGERQAMLAAGDGERHNTRIAAAYKLAGYIPHISEDEITAVLAVNFGPNEASARKTLADGIRAGRAAPRTIPDPKPQPVTEQASRIALGSVQVDDDLDDLDADELRRRLRAVVAERDRWKERAVQLELQLGQVQERNRFVTQAAGAEGIGNPGMRLTFIELKKELDRVPREEREPDQWVRIRPAYMAACTKQNRSTISNHLAAFQEAGKIEKDVRRVRDPETGEWLSETFVRPLVDLSDPTQVVIPSKPRGKPACRKCGSEKLVREVKIYCAECEELQSQYVELVNPPEPELQSANQEDDGLQEAIAFFDEQPTPVRDDPPSGLNCNLHITEKDSSSSLVKLQLQHQTPPAPDRPELQSANQASTYNQDYRQWDRPSALVFTDPLDLPGVRSGAIDPDDPWIVEEVRQQARAALQGDGP